MLEVREVGGALAAEICGIDLAADVDDATFREIEALWNRYGVIFFRGQKLTPAQHVGFSARFGELETHVRSNVCKPGYPQILVVSNIVENGKPIGSQDAGLFWHSDLCYKAQPSRGSLFYAREVPQENNKPLGDTMFASTSAAYEALPESTKRELVDLKGVNSYLKAYNVARKSGSRPPLTQEQLKEVPDVVHPVVRTHPFTGRKCLFVNEGYTTRIVGVSEQDSERLLSEIHRHVTGPQFVYRHQWQVGDFLMWDNCSTQHCAISDYRLPQRRWMERTTLHGSVPR